MTLRCAKQLLALKTGRIQPKAGETLGADTTRRGQDIQQAQREEDRKSREQMHQDSITMQNQWHQGTQQMALMNAQTKMVMLQAVMKHQAGYRGWASKLGGVEGIEWYS